MPIIAAQQIGIPLAEAFAHDVESEARVVARFASTLHLQCTAGLQWALTTHDNVSAHRIVLPQLPQWQPGAVVRVGKSRIAVNDLTIVWEQQALWDPRPMNRNLSAMERQKVTEALTEQLTRWGWSDARGFWETCAELWLPLQMGLQRCDTTTLQWGLERLLGLGVGLTPTGDDLLQALLVTLRCGDADDRRVFEALAQGVAPLLSRTTPLSRMFLQEALHGWAFGPLKALLEELPNVNETACDHLLRIGASSGVAYLLGVLLGLSYRNFFTATTATTTRSYPSSRRPLSASRSDSVCLCAKL